MSIERTFTISIKSTHPDAYLIVREATRTIACNLDWGDDQFCSIEAVETFEGANPAYLAGYEMEPGDDANDTDVAPISVQE